MILDWEKINKIEELSVQTGLSMVSNQRNNYEHILRLFVKSTEKCAGNMESFIAANDLYKFSREAHSVKNLLNNIGATNLGAKAQALEAAGDRMDFSFCSLNAGSFTSALNDIRKKIMEAFTEQPDENGPITIPPELSAVLLKIKKAISKMDFAEINRELQVLEKIELSGKVKDETIEIIDFLMVMEYDNAMNLIGKLFSSSNTDF